MYTIGDKKLAVGEKFTLKVDYTAGKVSTLPPVQSEKPDLLLPILLSLLGAGARASSPRSRCGGLSLPPIPPHRARLNLDSP